MLNPWNPVLLSIAGNDAFRYRLFKPPGIPCGIDSLTDSEGPSEHAEKVQALSWNLEHCCVTFLVVIFERRLIGPPRCAAYVRCGHASASFDYVSIRDDETISGDQDPTCQ